VPFTQSLLCYLLLWLTFYPRTLKDGWKQPLWKYAVLALLDVTATWCVVKAFNYSSITSVTLLDAWTVPCVMLLTALLLRRRCAHSANAC
jgi:solute carrier family 35, member F1/2